MLQGSFYDILRSNIDGCTIRFNALHPIFSGHFPEHPIVPGACIVQIAEELAVQTYRHPILFTSIRDFKLRQPITPDQEVMICLQQTEESACKILCIDATRDPQLIISFKAQFITI